MRISSPDCKQILPQTVAHDKMDADTTSVRIHFFICGINKGNKARGSIEKQMEVLQTERLCLRAFEEKDLEDYYAYCSDPEVGIHGGWPPHQSREQSREQLQQLMEQKNSWAICQKDTGRNIGLVALREDIRRHRSPQNCRVLSYLLARPYWGQGLMTEAVQEVLRYAFEEMGLQLVSTYRFSYNQRSGRVMEKLGFVHEGTLRQCTERFDGQLLDVMCYSMNREEYEQWKQKNSR